MEVVNFLNLKPTKGELKKLEIISSTIECIATIGFEKITYQVIADKLGTTRAHIAYHYSDKSEMIKACVHYIFSHYHTILVERLNQAEDNEEVLFTYVESPFVWAQDNPNELAVMILFYYLCLVDDDYRKMHYDLREAGTTRIMQILTHNCKLEIRAYEVENLAKQIQNLVSGAILDATTTDSRSIKKAKEETVANIRKLIESAK